jgi:ABC-type branched-subunit amino acid transport system substrate-binding protein
MSKRWLRIMAAVVALTLVAAACGSDDTETTPADTTPADTTPTEEAPTDSTPAEEAPTDGMLAEAPGFDGTTIRLGIISDLSGPVAVIGEPLTAGGQVYYDYINSQGGIAGMYPIETVEASSEYNPTVGVQVYNEMKDDIVMVGQLLGTPITNAVLESLKADNIVAAPASLDALWVREQNLLPIGAPYQIQAINGLDWWVNEGGGSVDQVYCTFIQDDPYGEAGQAGVDFAAENLGLTITETARYVSGETDFSAQIQQLQGAGCEVVFLVATPSVTGGALGAAAGAEFAPQWIGQSPSWINALAGSALAPYLQANFVVVAEGATWGDDSIPGMADMIARLAEFAPDQAPDYYFSFGYVQAQAVVAVLEAAVANGDLSRDGIITAMNGLGSLSFGQLSGDYFYGTPDQRQPATSSTIFAVDPEVPNGVVAVAMDYEAPFAADFVF